jgi:hypothetical protein
MAHFRISVVESRQREIVWLFDHLKALGHACAIIKHRISGQDKFRFTIWREGVEVINEESHDEYETENIEEFSSHSAGVTKTYIEPQIVKETGDFGRISGLI